MRINEDKIKKLQSGGFMTYQALPISPQQPVQQTSAPVTQTSMAGDTQTDGGRILDDDIFKELLGKGLTNDVMAFQDKIEGAYSEYNRMSSTERNTARGRRLRGIIKGDLGSINYMLRAKSQLEDAANIVKANDAFGELAVTSRGMIVKDLKTGKISEISHQAYADDIKGEDRKYIAITNSELINEREYNKNLIGDEKSFYALKSSIGMTKIKEEIQQVLSSITATTNKQSGNTIVDTSNAKVIQGVKQLQHLANTGMYDITQETSTESNKESLNRAIKAAWMGLSDNSRSVLMARAAARGVAPDKLQEEAANYVVSLLSIKENVSTSAKTDIKFNSELTRSLGKGSSDGSGKTAEIGPWEAIVGRIGTPETFKLNVGSGNHLNVRGVRNGPFQDHTGKAYGITSVTNIDKLASVADTRSIYFGDKRVDPTKLDGLIYDGQAVTSLEIPYITNPDGTVAPDFTATDKKAKADAELSKIPKSAQTVQVRETIYRKHNLNTNGRGEVPTTTFVRFKAYGNDDLTGGEMSEFLTNESDGPNADFAEKLYEKAYLKDEKGNDIDRPKFNKWFTLDPDIVSGFVFIPVTGNGIAARIADGKGPEVDKGMVSTDSYLNQAIDTHRNGTLAEEPSVLRYGLDALKALTNK